jgi:hypothetical protein
MLRKDNLKRLIIKNQSRLQILQEQEATYGLNTPPHILTEIEEIQAEIAELQAELAATPDDEPETDLARLAEDNAPISQPSGGPTFNLGGSIKAGNVNAGGTQTFAGPMSFDMDFSEKHIQGDEVHGDKSSVGNISGSGAVPIGRGAQATVSQGLSVADLATLFKSIYQQIEARPADPSVDKEEVIETVQKIEQEAAKIEQANPAKMERWLGNLAKMAPDILEVTVATLTNPVVGVATVIRKIAEKAKKEAGLA